MGIMSRFTKKTAVPEKTAAPLAAPVAPKGSLSRTGFSSVVVKPYLSEKSMMQEAAGVYTFVVRTGASKHAVADAVETLYGVRPTAVRVINVEGKTVRFGRSMGRRADIKKAVVTLPKGKTISIHEGV
jgi:large subunit ribosomal protein L23